jgi:hypothetical protein
MLERLNKKPASTQIVSSFDGSTRLCASGDSTALHLGPRALGWPRDLIAASRETHHGSGRITPPPSPPVAAMMLVAENDTTVERNIGVRTTRRPARTTCSSRRRSSFRGAATRLTTMARAGSGGSLDDGADGDGAGGNGDRREVPGRVAPSTEKVDGRREGGLCGDDRARERRAGARSRLRRRAALTLRARAGRRQNRKRASIPISRPSKLPP